MIKKLTLSILLVVGLFALATAQPYRYVNYDGVDDNFSTSANNSGAGIINWWDDGAAAAMPDGVLPAAGSNIIIDASTLTMDVPISFTSINVTGAPGGLAVNNTTLTVTGAFTVSGILSSATGSTISVGGAFTIATGGQANVPGVNFPNAKPSGAGAITPPVPVSPWAIVAFFGILAAFAYYKIRKRAIA